MVFEPVQGFHPSPFGGLRVVTAAGIVEEGVARPRVGHELEVLLLGQQLRFQTGHPRVDSRVLSGIDPQHRDLQVGHVFQGRSAAVEGDRRLKLWIANGHQPHDAAAEAEAHGADPVPPDVGLVLKKCNRGVAVVNDLVSWDAAQSGAHLVGVGEGIRAALPGEHVYRQSDVPFPGQTAG